jgi:predicted N-acetyltransferase YhbS
MSEHTTTRRDLGDGLVLRWSTKDDTQGVAELFQHVFRSKQEDPLNTTTYAYIHDQMSGNHPLIGPQDVALVEDTRTGTIISACSFMRTTWEYAGISFTLGRPEPVATHEDYRNRGLVRAQFGLMHERSAARGDLAQCITGIPYFYRQFGYEFAVDLGGGRNVYLASIPKLKEGESEQYTLRPATVDDIHQIMMLYERERTRHHAGQPMLVTAKFERSYWRWVLEGQRIEGGEGYNIWMIERAGDHIAGYVLTRKIRGRAESLGIGGLMTEPNVPITAVVPAVLRAVARLAPEVPVHPLAKPGELVRLGLWLGGDHPAYEALGQNAVQPDPPYGWYVRVPDVPAFLKRITPALERRLAGSALGGYTGKLTIELYGGGIELAFENGKLTTIEPWKRPIWGDEWQAGFPPLVFLQLVFGRRSLDELRYAFPDVWADDTGAFLLNTLFPKQTSWVTNQD